MRESVDAFRLRLSRIEVWTSWGQAKSDRNASRCRCHIHWSLQPRIYFSLEAQIVIQYISLEKKQKGECRKRYHCKSRRDWNRYFSLLFAFFFGLFRYQIKFACDDKKSFSCLYVVPARKLLLLIMWLACGGDAECRPLAMQRKKKCRPRLFGAYRSSADRQVPITFIKVIKISCSSRT